MKIDPIIPIWLMAIICVVIILIYKKGKFPHVRHILLVIFIFLINMRIMAFKHNVKGNDIKLDAYVVFIIDDTLSMQARDIEGEMSRLSKVKTDCAQIIDNLYGAQFTVITFNNTAQVLSPFTSDTEYIKQTINLVYPLSADIARGTSLNICSTVLEDTLKKAYEKQNGKVILFYMGDGENTDESQVEPFSFAKKYIADGAVLGYGTKEGGIMYEEQILGASVDPVKDTNTNEDAVSVIDEDNLKKIASDMDINYVNMTDKSDIDSITSKINTSSTTTTTDAKISVYSNLYYIFSIPVAILLLIEFILYRRGGILK